jgi:hypothetical protein
MSEIHECPAKDMNIFAAAATARTTRKKACGLLDIAL